MLATDPLPHRRMAAVAYGADVVLDATATAGELAAFTGGRGADVAFEIAGTDAAIESAVTVVRPGGRVVLGGIPSTDTSSFPAATARRKGLTFAMVRRMPEVYPRALALVTGGRADVRSLVSHRYPLTSVAEAFPVADARKGLKVLIEPNGH